MKLETRLPLATVFYKHWDNEDQEIGVVVAKAAFHRSADGQFRPTAKPPELRFSDMFSGDAATSSLEAEQDIAPGKPATDLLIRAVARSFAGKAMSDWPVSIRIKDRLHYEFRVRGPAKWQHRFMGWKLDAPTPVMQVPLEYELAWGGVLRDADNAIITLSEVNPAGRGFCTKSWLDARRDPFDAPMIGFLAEMMQSDPLAPASVHGTRPVAKTWLPRRAFAGTFDSDWQQSRHPRMPQDYALEFWNCAHRPLQLSPHLAGDEIIEVHGISAGGPVLLPLPSAALALHVEGATQMGISMVLDTVEADLAAENPAEHRLEMTWRARIPAPERFFRAELLGADINHQKGP